MCELINYVCQPRIEHPVFGPHCWTVYDNTIRLSHNRSEPWAEKNAGGGGGQCYPEFALHPREMQQTERDEYKHIVSSVKEMYGIDNFVEETLTWYDVQKHNPLDDNSLGMIELVKQTTLFPAVRKAILITLTVCNIMYSGKVLQHNA